MRSVLIHLALAIQPMLYSYMTSLRNSNLLIFLHPNYLSIYHRGVSDTFVLELAFRHELFKHIFIKHLFSFTLQVLDEYASRLCMTSTNGSSGYDSFIPFASVSHPFDFDSDSIRTFFFRSPFVFGTFELDVRCLDLKLRK